MDETTGREFRYTSKSKKYFLKEIFLLWGITFLVLEIIFAFIDWKFALLCLIPNGIFLGLQVLYFWGVYRQHRAVNINTVVVVIADKREIRINQENRQFVFSFDDIHEITLYRQKPHSKWMTELLQFALITLNDGNKFIISTLLIHNLQEYLRDLGLSYKEQYGIAFITPEIADSLINYDDITAKPRRNVSEPQSVRITEWHCPLLNRTIDEGLCVDIQMWIMHAMKADSVIEGVLEETKLSTREEVDAICNLCPNNPYKDTTAMDGQ